MADPEQFNLWEKIAMWVGAGAGSAYAAWKIRGSKRVQRRLPSPEEYNATRRISRQEWHDICDKLHATVIKVDLARRSLDDLRGDHTNLMARFEQHIAASTRVWENFARLDERVANHIARWEAVGERAEEDRKVMVGELKLLNDKLDRLRSPR